MLTRIDLRGFKCFTLLKLSLRPLTLLAGANGSGKSSVLQSLVLLHQTIREHEWSSQLMLNGDSINLGTAADVINQGQDNRACEISLQEDDGSYVQWEAGGERSDMNMAVKRVRAVFTDGAYENAVGSNPLRYLLPRDVLSSGKARSLAHRLRQLTYLTAQRLGPRDTYPLERRQFPVVGPQGQYTASVLYSEDEECALKGLAADGTAPTLLHQARACMDGFFPGCEFVVEKSPKSRRIDTRHTDVQENGVPASRPYRIRDDAGASNSRRGAVGR